MRFNTDTPTGQIMEKINVYNNRIARTREDVARITEEIRDKEIELAGIIASGDFTGSKELKAEIKQKQGELEDVKSYLRVQEENKGNTGYESEGPELLKYLDSLQEDVKKRIAAKEEEIQKAKAVYIESLKGINALRREAYENHSEVTSVLRTLKDFTGKYVEIPSRILLNDLHSKVIVNNSYENGTIYGDLGLTEDLQRFYVYGQKSRNVDTLIRKKKLTEGDIDGITFNGDSVYDVCE